MSNFIESFSDGLALSVDDLGNGRPILVLHGGAGPNSVAAFAQSLSPFARVIVPTHPGFAGQPRPDWFDGIDDLVLTYFELLERLDLRDVMVVGFSIGGWVAAELAVRASSRLRSLVLVDAVGIEVEGHAIADVFDMPRSELLARSYHDPSAVPVEPESPERAAMLAANFRALATYGRARGMRDPKLKRRLKRVSIPALVVWGESDRIVDVGYGQAYAASLPHVQFEIIRGAGHVPQIEKLSTLVRVVRDFADITGA